MGKINVVHEAIRQRKLEEEKSKASLEKPFQPITAKLNEVIACNLKPSRKIACKREEAKAPDYTVTAADDAPGMDLGDFFEPQEKPPANEPTLKDLLGSSHAYEEEGYDHFSGYEVETESEQGDGEDDAEINKALKAMGVMSYEAVEDALSSQEISKTTKKNILEKRVLGRATYKLKGYKTAVTKQYKKGELTDLERSIKNQKIDEKREILNQYVKHYRNKLKTFQGSGIKRGKGVTFFNDPKELLKKLELIIGEIAADNTSVEMRNIGVAILYILLKSLTLNKSQHAKIYKRYFKNG